MDILKAYFHARTIVLVAEKKMDVSLLGASTDVVKSTHPFVQKYFKIFVQELQRAKWQIENNYLCTSEWRASWSYEKSKMP